MGRKKDVRGRLVLVTGAGRGIGRAIALELSMAGARLGIADLDLASAEEVALELERAGKEARAYRLDVTEPGGFDALVDRIERELGPIDILINNAGIMIIGSFLDHGQREDSMQIAVNFSGVANGMRAVLPRMLARGQGHVVNIASMAGRVGSPHVATYSATKFAVIGLTEAVRAELLGRGIDFSYVMPALVNTELISGTGRPRWPPVLQPADVARAVRRGIERRRLDVYVPSWGSMSIILPWILPQRVLDWLAHLLGIDTMFSRIDDQKRSRYLDRTSGIPRDKP